VTTNLWTVGQGVVTRQLRAQSQQAPAKRTSRTPPKAEQAGDAAPANAPAAAPKQTSGPKRVRKKKKRARR
jgi:hypothetical protein